MQFDIQQKISPFVSSQFPEFYKTEGPNFILFVQAYYEFLEQEYGPTYAANGLPTSTNVLHQARNLMDYRDIDNTLESFLEHFQKKYLYGIPFNVIINKRFLLKHILDVYRSKGSIQCYRLLFKLIYNEDIEVYLPGVDLLAPSDGTWYVPTYIEINYDTDAASLVGKTILGLSSNTSAVVESYVTEPINGNRITSLYISNISPRNAVFYEGETIIDAAEADELDVASLNAPIITGSLNDLEIRNGGQGFSAGDTLAIVHRDTTNNSVVSFGINGIVRVDSVTQAFGSLSFAITHGGFGISATPLVKVYPGNGNTAGNGASFSIGAIANTQSIVYNTDVIANYLTTTMDASVYGLPANAAANLTANIGTSLGWANQVFGTPIFLTNIRTGNGYTTTANVFVHTVENSLALPGTVTWSGNTVTGTATNFDWYFGNNRHIVLQSNSSALSQETIVIKSVTNSTSMVLFGPPSQASNGTSAFYVAPPILWANFTPTESYMASVDGTINSNNSLVSGIPSTGNSVVGTVTVVDSGKGYVDFEDVQLYLYSGVDTPVILAGGTAYTNGDLLVFSGGGGGKLANGYVSTNTTGGITSTVIVNAGSGLRVPPTVTVQSRTGSGALLTANLIQFNTTSQVTARVIKGGVGRGRGYWTTTKGFLNSDKYIQDSYFYQDYSYQIRAASMLADYRDILYNTFHPAGAELFGEFQLITLEHANSAIAYENSIANTGFTQWFTADSTAFTADISSAKYTADIEILNPYTADSSSITIDRADILADQL